MKGRRETARGPGAEGVLARGVWGGYISVAMDNSTLIGIAIIACSLAVLTYLTFWSRRTIERIARGRGRSAREIQKELGDE